MWGEKVAEFGNEETFLVSVCPSYNSSRTTFYFYMQDKNAIGNKFVRLNLILFGIRKHLEGFEGFGMRTTMKITTTSVTVVMITMMMITTLQCAI